MNKIGLNRNFVSSILSFLVVFSLVFPSEYNALAIYMFCGFSLFYMIKEKSFKWRNTFVVLSLLFFFLHFLYLFFDDNRASTGFEIEKKLGFLVLPLSWFNLPVTDPKSVAKIALRWFSIAMSFFGLFLLSYALIDSNYLETTGSFFYHNFVQVFEGSAIYYSLLFLVSLLVLIEGNRERPSVLTFISIAFQSFVLVLLSSKLFVLILSIILLYAGFTSKRKVSVVLVSFCLIGGLFFANQNSVLNRFKEIDVNSFFALRNEIHPGTKFDGFTLRKELWNIGLEVVENGNYSLFLGVGPGDAQDEINKKLVEKNFYLGNEKYSNKGYYNYNSHSQYIQSLVETGFFGLSILLLMFLFFFQNGFSSANRLLVLFNSVIIVAFMTESYLNRQIGIISFLGFNCLFLELQSVDYSKQFKSAVKRAFDLLFSGLVLVLILSWLLPLMGLLIYIDTKSFPLFVQNRVGKNGCVFRCFKMRTMIANTEADFVPAMKGDVRITRFGNILRKFAVDELPQFFNVFLGQMSVVGPRPLMVREEKEWNSKITGFTDRLKLKPGITGLAQAHGYKGIINHKADLMVRFRLDKLYCKKQSLWLDTKIIIRTIIYIFN